MNILHGFWMVIDCDGSPTYPFQFLCSDAEAMEAARLMDDDEPGLAPHRVVRCTANWSQMQHALDTEEATPCAA